MSCCRRRPVAGPLPSNVDIIDFGFSPQNVTIAVGDTVTWTNTGSFTHTTTSGTTTGGTRHPDGLWDSGSLLPGKSFSHVFAQAGTFPYYCTPHFTSMTGTVTVNTTPIADPIQAHIAKGDITIELQPIVDGLAAPLGIAVPDDGSKRMFVYDQAGLAWVVTAEAGKLPTPLLDARSRLVTFGNYDERGLLGLATHPDFAHHPLVYTYTSEPIAGTADFVNVMPVGAMNNCQSVLAEWRIDPAHPNQVDPASRREILRIDKPQSNHNGGTLRFGPEGFLYISLGDGGKANDVADGHVPGGNAQNLQRIWGKLLRIDVDGRDSANGRYGIPQDNPFVGQNKAGDTHTLYFTAGIAGGGTVEDHGLFGGIAPSASVTANTTEGAQ
ncbi:MAG: PQQ-dependent sugar dehydrogenase [Planctomycetes bacterium]|nr:PQQ-dependent sugar dehydrogenase [Planctomycetota bacterium]